MASTPENSALSSGLAALKQKDYQSAIAHLEEVCQLELDLSRVERAQIGLVTAYAQVGDREKAIAIAQTLTHSRNPRSANWANKTLEKLSQAATPQKTADVTGFVPMASPPAKPSFSLKRQPKTESAALTAEHLSTQQSETETRLQLDSSPPPSSEPPLTRKPSELSQQNRQWHQAGRAQRWGNLPQNISLVGSPQLLWGLQIATAIALFWWMRFTFRYGGPKINDLLLRLPLVNPLGFLYQDPTQLFLAILVILAVGLPWIVTGLLKFFYESQPLPLETLSAYSPDAVRTLQRYCRQRRLALPQLQLLPNPAPLIFTYGHLPKTACIVVSQGLLEQLGEEEIAAIYATQLGQIVHWDFAVMSWGVLLLQIPYLLYIQASIWSEKISDRFEHPFLINLIQGLGATIASLMYGIYWILQFPLLWLSRWRLFYSDAEAVAITGHPNALIRALLKIAMGVADTVAEDNSARPKRDKSTRWLLESFNFLLPVGYKQALLFSAQTSDRTFEELLAWDLRNPYRRWLVALKGHPLLGDRLSRLTHYARFWRLEPELDLPSPPRPFRWTQTNLQQWATTTTQQLLHNAQAWPLLPSAIAYGCLGGLALRGFLWVVGKISYELYIWQLVWLSQDKLGYLFAACWLICFGVYLLVRINSYFPEVTATNAKTERDVLKLQLSERSLPPQSTPIRLVGKLTGRRGIGNALAQDLTIQSPAGPIKLHHYPLLGPLAYFGSGFPQPGAWIGQTVTVTGWLRRGATPWIDVEQIRTRNNRTARNYQPIWLTLMAFAVVAWAAYLIWTTPAT